MSRKLLYYITEKKNLNFSMKYSKERSDNILVTDDTKVRKEFIY